MEVRDLLTQYEFPGDKIPIVKGSALKALNGDADAEKQVLALVEAIDDYIPVPERPVDQPFLMPIEDVFNIEGRGTVATGRVERGILKKMGEVELALGGEECEEVAGGGGIAQESKKTTIRIRYNNRKRLVFVRVRDLPRVESNPSF